MCFLVQMLGLAHHVTPIGAHNDCSDVLQLDLGDRFFTDRGQDVVVQRSVKPRWTWSPVRQT